MTFSVKAAVVLFTALSYCFLLVLNEAVFSFSGYSEGAGWIFLPSGLRLAFVLVFAELGAIGIGLATLSVGLRYHTGTDYWTPIGAGFVAGFAPLLALLVCTNQFKLDANLANLSPSRLLKVAGVFSLTSSVLCQLWLTWAGKTTSFVQSAAIMVVGDFIGTLVMLFLARFILNLLPDFARR